MRMIVTLALLVGGMALAAVSYFFLAAPLGLPTQEGFSNPRVPFATAFFLVGVALALLSAVVYELLPESKPT